MTGVEREISMGQFLQDLRYATRQLRKSPGFTLTALITLALGIGVNAAIFTLVQGILLKSLPVLDPKDLYRIGDTDDCCVNGGFVGQNGDFDIYSYDLYLHLKQSTPEFEQLAAMQAGQNMYSVRRGVLAQIGLGLALGIPCALVCSHFMQSQLYGVGSYDPLSLGGAIAVLAVCALAAGFLPARRAASIEPMRALRID